MRLIFVATGIAALSLAACGQQQDDPPAQETVAAEDVAIDSAATTTAPETGPVVDSAMQETEVPPADGVTPGPVTGDTRANAQTQAETTNLHPRTE